MSERGKGLLAIIASGKPAKGAKMGADSAAEEADEYAPNEGAMMAAEDLCRALGVDESKAKAVAQAICDIVDNHMSMGADEK